MSDEDEFKDVQTRDLTSLISENNDNYQDLSFFEYDLFMCICSEKTVDINIQVICKRTLTKS